MKLSELAKRLLEALRFFSQGFRERAVDTIEKELSEMESSFALLLYSSLVGLPSPPPLVGLSLLPYMERELSIMLAKSRHLDDAWAVWADLADI
ncbi:MAG: hypothetical protein DRI92_03620 [Aquificota bacterium]|uniref:Uncharacterized protein n=1 Tax=Thermosulfidibacter takaii TaxID=412593 RepID=A0A7C0U6H1_9BACT|nr:MAG: hypothetical protein DRI92_03620 [Aquificota bacterium]HDD53264.1 hypothetical protein [Thermosulfidibacter takaii]